ncbi:MAG TPA: hypothetical protein VNI77_12410, partial [Nitrososphaera sp.]|nr:hypothetical protein [Nitrososphaera sp.]
MDYKAYALMAILMASVVSVALVGVANAQTGLTVQTDRSSYSSGDDITITGQVGSVSADQPILIRVLSPQGNLVRADQITVAADGSYTYTFRSGGLMNIDGEYTVIVSYGANESET